MVCSGSFLFRRGRGLLAHPADDMSLERLPVGTLKEKVVTVDTDFDWIINDEVVRCVSPFWGVRTDVDHSGEGDV